MYVRDVESALRAAADNPYWRQADAELVLSLWADSGQPLATFARQFGHSVRRLYRWRRRLGTLQVPALYPVELVASPVAQAPGGVSAPGPGGEVEVVLRGGRRVAVRPGFDARHLAQVAAAVESWGC